MYNVYKKSLIVIHTWCAYVLQYITHIHIPYAIILVVHDQQNTDVLVNDYLPNTGSVRGATFSHTFHMYYVNYYIITR